MTSVTVDLSDNQYQKLQTLANLHGIAPEALLKASLEDWLNTQKHEFSAAVDHVLQKNTELYQRLA
ncbi:MAG: DNA-binding protein [Cyanobacteria bacterium P01_D01_bin.6]